MLAFIPAAFLSHQFSCARPIRATSPSLLLSHTAFTCRFGPSLPSTIPFVCQSHMGSLIHPVSDLLHKLFRTMLRRVILLVVDRALAAQKRIVEND